MNNLKSYIYYFLSNKDNTLISLLFALIINRNSPFFKLKFILFKTLPLLKGIKNKHKIINLKITHTGKLFLFTNGFVLKIPFSELANFDLELEIKNHKKLNSSNYKYFNYSLKSINGIYLMSNLKPLDPKQVVPFKEIIGDLKKISLKKNHSLKVELVIDFLKQKISPSFSELSSILTKLNISYGPSHNDLTRHNVMLYKNKLVLIDLSKFEFNSFSKFDLLHKEIRDKCISKKINFFELFTKYKKYQKGEYLVYFVYRIYFETKLGFSKSYKNSAIHCLKSILKN